MSRYAKAHEERNGPGDARPTALQIIKDEGREGTLADKVFLVTGASSGIGIETGRALAATGGKVFLAVRDLEKGKAACQSFLEPGRVELIELDVSKLQSVRQAAATFLQQSKQLNVLVCNAGIMTVPTREETEDGFEMQLATNYLGHFLLFWLLKDVLLKSSTPDFQSRLINVSSSGHHASEIVWDDLNLTKEGAYDPTGAYGQSKLAQIYHANYVDRNFGSEGLHALSLMPGGIIETGLSKYTPKEMVDGFRQHPVLSKWVKSREQGAATTVIAAVGKEWEGKGGEYLEDCVVAPSGEFMPNLMGIKEYIHDESKENKLWELTLKTLGL
ncbi:short chain dehydrogenase [Xylaria bambusicola]|uniref:short chain dehydrogenase n=1 Tax=Xylaria bambusicola TaxID=326684 RepID=UPI00200810FB|nr:short chain dehydrogenase [Xylaria bambusicola]KAI0508924.1 short chain dehydrogenase [Xylaria bambusicola]